MSKPLRLILASASPRRAQLLREHGYDFTVVVPPIGEPALRDAHLPAAQQAEALSYFKAGSVLSKVPHGCILGADTVAALEGRIFGKPADRADARRILTVLGGTTHQVITGVTLLDAASQVRLIRHDVTLVTMRKLGDARLDAYLDSGEWQDKAGAYGIQEVHDEFVERIDGSFTNVMGLPMELLSAMLHESSAPRHTM